MTTVFLSHISVSKHHVIMSHLFSPSFTHFISDWPAHHLRKKADHLKAMTASLHGSPPYIPNPPHQDTHCPFPCPPLKTETNSLPWDSQQEASAVKSCWSRSRVQQLKAWEPFGVSLLKVWLYLTVTNTRTCGQHVECTSQDASFFAPCVHAFNRSTISLPCKCRIDYMPSQTSAWCCDYSGKCVSFSFWSRQR